MFLGALDQPALVIIIIPLPLRSGKAPSMVTVTYSSPVNFKDV
jgi:hypothetical protein